MYDKEIFLDILRSKGYNKTEMVRALTIINNRGSQACKNRIEDGEFTRSELEQIARYFEFTPKEFAEAFFRGMFEASPTGRVYAQADIELLDKVEDVLRRAKEK